MNWTYSESFAGIGAWGKAIKRVTKRHDDTCELKWYAELDKYASNAFAAIHGESEDKNIWDITKDIQVDPVDIFFYSPPCQSFSLAGKREGTTVDKGNLFYNALQGIIKSNPKYAIMENVANLKNQFADDFNSMLKALENAGYISYAKVLNSKHYGIPQNRERIFIVSVRNDLYENSCFEWPVEIPLKAKLKDVLEDEVDEKYYINKEWKITKGKKDCHDENEIAQIIGGDYKATRTVTDINKISRCLDTMTGGQREPKILVKSATKNGYETAYQGDSINLEHPNSETKRGRVVAQTLTTSCNQGIFLPCVAVSRGQNKNNSNDRTKGNKNLSQTLEFNQQGTSNALTTVQKDNYVVEPYDVFELRADEGIRKFKDNVCGTLRTIDGCENKHTMNVDYKIRKLSPLECFRLQGFDDEDYYKAVKGYDETFGTNAAGSTRSDSQMYKRAGNTITVNVIEEILENLLYNRKQSGNQISIF